MCQCEDRPCCGCDQEESSQDEEREMLRDEQDQEDDRYDPNDHSDDDGMTDAEADANTLASAGWGTDEDYGDFGIGCGFDD